MSFGDCCRKSRKGSASMITGGLVSEKFEGEKREEIAFPYKGKKKPTVSGS